MTNHTDTNAEQLRSFAVRVYYECRLRLGTEPACIPVFGAGGDDQNVSIRGLVHAPTTRRRSLTRDWAERCLSELMADLFEHERPRYGAITFAAQPLEPAAQEQLIVVVANGIFGGAMSFICPDPSLDPDPPHLAAESQGARPAIVETLRELFAGAEPRISVGDDQLWMTWLARCRAAGAQPSNRQQRV